MRALLLAALLVLSGCSIAPGCYVGVAIYPLGPFIHCGADTAPEEKPDVREDT